MEYEKIEKQIKDSGANVQYTYIAHWIIVNRLKCRYQCIKIVQIILTALSTGGILTSIFAGIDWWSGIGVVASAISLALNLYMLNFNLPSVIAQHEKAAKELWSIREHYKSLSVDFNDLSLNEIREKRDNLIKETDFVYKKYPGTDRKSFNQAKKNIRYYLFEQGEADTIL